MEPSLWDNIRSGFYLQGFYGYDKVAISLMLVVALIACLRMFFLRSHVPLDSTYLILASLPSLSGLVIGLGMYDWGVYRWAAYDRHQRYLLVDGRNQGGVDTLQGILCVQYGLLLSALLLLALLYFYGRDRFFPSKGPESVGERRH